MREVSDSPVFPTGQATEQAAHLSWTKSILEVSAVFLLTLVLFRAVRSSPLGGWEGQVLQRTFLEYLVVMLIPLVMLWLARTDLTAYGISLKNLKPDLDAAAKCFIPVAAIAIALNFVDWKQWTGASIVAAIEVVMLFAIAWLLRKRASVDEPIAGPLLILLAGVVISGVFVAQASGMANMVSALLFSFVFAAPAEEILFRGYSQSRLNAAFGRPYRFLSIPWGWGLVITALLFALWHVVIPFNPFAGEFELALPHGLWTFVAGLIFGIVREKTDGIVAPAIIHGVLNFV